MLRSVRRMFVVLSCALILNATALVAVANTTTVASATTAVGFSGREFFPGFHYGGATYGAAFAGVTTTGGVMFATVNYAGTAGIGNTVTIFGGSSALLNGDGSRLYGRVTGGAVQWPSTLGSDIGCGAGVATFNATLSNGGAISGCLDDTHQATVFPPTIVGTLTLP